MQQNQQQQKPYQRRVLTLETQRGTVLAQIHEMRAQLIDLTVKAYAGIERRIQSKQRFIAAKWKQLLGIEMDLVAADEEIGNVWARIRLIAEVEIPAKEQVIELLQAERYAIYEKRVERTAEFHQIQSSGKGRLKRIVGGPIQAFRDVNTLNGIVANDERLVAQRTHILQQLARMEPDIPRLQGEIAQLRTRVTRLQAGKQRTQGAYDLLLAEISDLLEEDLAELEAERFDPPETRELRDELSKLTAQDERLVATITTILDERRAEILDEAGKLRTQIAYPAASGWDVIEGLLLELAFINQHHP
jgi:hypothetical protein